MDFLKKNWQTIAIVLAGLYVNNRYPIPVVATESMRQAYEATKQSK